MIYKYKCEKCGKKIQSLDENQFNYNKEQHQLKHIRKDLKIEEKEMNNGRE